MHVTACLAGQDEVEVEVGEECRTLQALKEAIVVALPKLCVEGFDVSVGGRALDDDEGVVSLSEGVRLDVSVNTRVVSVLALREAGREVSEDGLFEAVSTGDMLQCTLYLAAGVPIDCLHPDEHYFHHTPLHKACYGGHLEIVTLLLDRGSTAIDRESGRGETPLFISCRKGHLEIARLLLDRGSTAIDVKTLNGYTPLDVSHIHDLEITRLLLDRGCSVDVKKYKAHYNNLPNFLECLAERGHDVLPDASPPRTKRRRRTKQSDQ